MNYLCRVKQRTNNNDYKQELLEQWAGELMNVKAQLLQVSWLLQQGVLLTRQQEAELNELIDRRKRLEQLIEEVRKMK